MSSDEGIARWRHVADGIRQMISDGGGVLERLPPEADLAERFRVNRHTVRRAIGALSTEGLLRAERGRGTFVERMPERLAYPLGARTRFSENVSGQSRQPGGRLISAWREGADAAVARRLNIATGEPVFRLDTLRSVDGVPLSIDTSWFPALRCPDIVAAFGESASITQALSAQGIADYRRLETRIRAERVDASDAGHLACASDAVVLVTEAINIDGEERPIQFGRARIVADRIELVVRN